MSFAAINHRLEQACAKDPKIVTARNDLARAEGFTTEYLESLGLRKTDLKTLESHGLAKRGYTKNVWFPGETNPRGQVVPEKAQDRGPGHRVRWVLVI